MCDSNTIKQKCSEGFAEFLPNMLCLLVVFLLMRLYEYFALSMTLKLPAQTGWLELKGGCWDFALVIRLLTSLALPFLLIRLVSTQASRWFLQLCGLLLLITNLALIQYFRTTSLPLGADVFGYSFSEISHTVKASGKFDILNLLPFLVFPFLYLYACAKWKILRPSKIVIGICSALAILSISGLLPIVSNPAESTSDFKYGLLNNKLSFFFVKTKEYLDASTEPGPILVNYYTDEDPSSQNDFQFTNKDYPFLHKELSKDVLSPYFTFNKQPPNLVFIVVEGLGRAFSGPGATLGSFTPFLDSLAGHSLYWTNLLSSGGRTFAVLPSLFGSLPFAEKGFLDLGEKAPARLSLPALLKKNGYSTHFFYGGDSHFDKMDLFLKQDQVDLLVDESSYGPGYAKMPLVNGETWGYGDRELFRKGLESLQLNKQTPALDIYLTVASHSPFVVNDQLLYMDQFKQIVSSRHLPEESKAEYDKYAANYSSVLFADDAIRFFMKSARQSPNYANTVFVITGDHQMPEMPVDGKLDRFHVPLIIFSPMLNKPAVFASVSSHLDVCPSLLMLLKANFGLHLPTETAWIGHGLDASVLFRSIHAFPLMRNKNQLYDFIDGAYLLSDGELYMMNSKLDVQPVKDQEKKEQMKKSFEAYKSKSLYVCSKNKLIPDSLKTRYSY
jgi:phosphoglycerol transferase MdoB-like AlkP superfamily enzyme